jgi:large subunit ribosomal protein L6
MSKKGRKILQIPKNVNISVKKNTIMINGPLGTLSVSYPEENINIKHENNTIKVLRNNDEKKAKEMHGTVNSNINNALIGVSTGYTKILKIVGVGYKASVKNNELTLAIGFSHPIILTIPNELTVISPEATQIIIKGCDKILVGGFAAKIRSIRKPEPYKGKGIMYSDEKITRKVGKKAETAKGGGTTPAPAKK